MTYKVLINGRLNTSLLSDVKKSFEPYDLEIEVTKTYYNRTKEQTLCICGVINNYNHDKFVSLLDNLPDTDATGRITCVDEDMNAWQFRKANDYDTWTCVNMKIIKDD